MARRTTVSNRGRCGDDESRSRRHHGDLRRLSRSRFLGIAGLHHRHLLSFVYFHSGCSGVARAPRKKPNVQGFVRGAYGAAIGTILGACILLGRIAIGDWLTVLIGVISLAVLFRWNVSNPLLIAATAVVGLIAFPLLQPTWVMVH